jgi:hypothetical protein
MEAGVIGVRVRIHHAFRLHLTQTIPSSRRPTPHAPRHTNQFLFYPASSHLRYTRYIYNLSARTRNVRSTSTTNTSHSSTMAESVRPALTLTFQLTFLGEWTVIQLWAFFLPAVITLVIIFVLIWYCLGSRKAKRKQLKMQARMEGQRGGIVVTTCTGPRHELA